MNRGYIKLYRKVMDSFVWTNPQMLKLWMLCLMKASHENRKFLFNGQEIRVSSGQFVTGRDAIGKEFNEGVPSDQRVVSRTLWRWLKKFENEQMLSIESNTKYSIISIKNWSEYQVSDQQLSSDCPSSVQHLSTYKNEKNEKNDKKVVVSEKNDFSNVVQSYEQVFGMINSLTIQNLQMWCEDLSPDLVLEAIKISAKANAYSFKYAETILKKWEKQNVKTLDDVAALDKKFEKKNQEKQNGKRLANERDYSDDALPF